MSYRTCPDWPELMELAPDLQFKHYALSEVELPGDAMLGVDVPRDADICCDIDRHVYFARHTDPRVVEALKHGGVAIPPLSDRRRASVEAFASRMDPDPGHSLHVQALCDQLFDGLMPSFELGDTEREWLAAAARLHDIGFSLSEKGHHKHGAYLVRNAPLQGFWPEEVEIIAQVVRHHRGKAPDPGKHEAFRQLAPWHQATVAKLAAILRAADALDRRRRQAVKHVRVEDDGESLCLVAEGQGDLRAEAEAFQDKGRLLMKLLDRPLGLALG